MVTFPSWLNCSLSKSAAGEMQSDSKGGAITAAFMVSSKSKDSLDAVWILDSWMPANSAKFAPIREK